MIKYPIDKIFAELPQHSGETDPDEIIREKGDKMVIVLDDDPTGTQTVCNVPVLTEWSYEIIHREFASGTGLFYILTNTRSFPAAEAIAINREATLNIRKASEKLNRKFLIISRSDSTLRGHFPEETETIAASIGMQNYLTVLNPAFFEGGRYTIGNRHYVREGDYLIGAEHTPYARDEVFGFSSGDLYEYVVEKSGGRIMRDEIFDLDIRSLRTLPVEEVTGMILQGHGTGKKVLIVNAADYKDEQRAVLALLKSANLGLDLVFRTAASIVPVMGGIRKNDLLKKEDFSGSASGGLIIVGSYIEKTSRQLESLLRVSGINAIKINVKWIFEAGWPEKMMSLTPGIDRLLREGRDVVIFTSRELKTGDEKAGNLEIGRKVSEGLTGIIRNLKEKPAFIISKGGITSSDIATRGLGVRKAMVRGQIIPGVPVWLLGNEAKFPGLDYVVFPGNVGDDDALTVTYNLIRT